MQNVLKEIIKDTIAPLFKAKGFKKKGNNFAKTFSDFAWVVNIQNSKWNTKEEIEFTFNTGIFTDKLFGTFYEIEPPQFPTEIYSVLRLRVTELKKMPDEWYKITPITNIEELKSKIQSDIENVLFPHFEQFQTIENVIKEMEKLEEQGRFECPHFLTILYQSYGYNKEAQCRISKMYSELIEPQKEFTKELAERLGLNVN
jgi:hypothetical protein